MNSDSKALSFWLNSRKPGFEFGGSSVVEFTLVIEAMGNAPVAQEVPFVLELAQRSQERRIVTELLESFDEALKRCVFVVLARHVEREPASYALLHPFQCL